MNEQHELWTCDQTMQLYSSLFYPLFDVNYKLQKCRYLHVCVLPIVSILCVTRSVREPILAAAHAASVPAWPPPTTITSNCELRELSLLAVGLSVRATCRRSPLHNAHLSSILPAAYTATKVYVMPRLSDIILQSSITSGLSISRRYS